MTLDWLISLINEGLHLCENEEGVVQELTDRVVHQFDKSHSCTENNKEQL